MTIDELIKGWRETGKQWAEERAMHMHILGGIPKEKAEALARAECETYAAHREQVAKDSKEQK